MKKQPKIKVEVVGELSDEAAKNAVIILNKIWERHYREQGKRFVVKK